MVLKRLKKNRINKSPAISRELLRKVQAFIDAEWIAPAASEDRAKDRSDRFEQSVFSSEYAPMPDVGYGGSAFPGTYEDTESYYEVPEDILFDEPELSSGEEMPFDEQELSAGDDIPFGKPDHSVYGDIPFTEPDHSVGYGKPFAGSDLSEKYAGLSDEEVTKSKRRVGPLESRRRACAPAVKRNIEDIIDGLGQTFQEKLLAIIDSKGLKDSEVYSRANIDRRLFSKIRSNKNYKPSKPTALAFAIALGLNLDETTDLLQRAGLALSPSSKGDLIVKYCILNGIYDIFDVNAILYEFDQQLLGC